MMQGICCRNVKQGGAACQCLPRLISEGLLPHGICETILSELYSNGHNVSVLPVYYVQAGSLMP